MDPCTCCGEETDLYLNDKPICLACMKLIEEGKQPRRKQPQGGDEESSEKKELPGWNRREV